MRFSLLSPVFLFLVCQNAFSQSFSPQILSTYCPYQTTISWVDIDVDGKKDIVLPNSSYSKFNWIRNLGNSYFGPPLPLQTPDIGNLVHGCFADMDQDGKMDLVSVRNTGGSTSWMFVGKELVWQKNMGSGSFGPVQLIETMPGNFDLTFLRNMISKDLNGDGRPDFIVPITDANPICIVSFYYAFITSAAFDQYEFAYASTGYDDNTSYGTLEPFQSGLNSDWYYLRNANYNSFSGVYVGDAVQSDSVPTLPSQLVNNQELTLGAGTSTIYDIQAQIGNLTGDSSVEIVCYCKTSLNDPTYKLSYNTNPGLPGVVYHLIESGTGTISSFAIVDFDKDGRTDIVASKENNIIWYQNIGQGLFAAPQVLFEFNTSFNSISVEDADMDSDYDIIGYSASENQLYYLENGGPLKLCVSGTIVSNCWK